MVLPLWETQRRLLRRPRERVTLGDEEGWEVAKRHVDHGRGKETESGVGVYRRENHLDSLVSLFNNCEEAP